MKEEDNLKIVLVIGLIALFIAISYYSSSAITTTKDKFSDAVDRNKISNDNFDIPALSLKCERKVPECVEKGDILIMDMTLFQESKYMIPGPYNEHTALYIGNNQFVHAGGDGNPPQVVIRNYSRFYDPAKNLAFVRVTTANRSQINAAINFSLDQLGKRFQSYLTVYDFPWFDLKYHNPDHFLIPNANKWYCVELPWAAYYNQGIDIDSNGWKLNIPGYRPIIAINEIIEDGDTEIIYCELDDYIEIIHPNGGTYVANKKISHFPFLKKANVWGKIDVIVNTSLEPYLVEFYIGKNGKKLAHIDYNEPYSWTWNKIGFGKNILKVVARDEFENILDSYEVSVKKFF